METYSAAMSLRAKCALGLLIASGLWPLLDAWVLRSGDLGAIAIAVYIFVISIGMSFVGALIALAALTDPTENRKTATVLALLNGAVLLGYVLLLIRHR